MRIRSTPVLLAALVSTALPASAQWDPNNGDWGKEDATDLRVMTWNVEDGLCRTNGKSDALNNWNALVRIVAALEPDVLILQECGDNSGNGSGGGVDSVIDLETVAQLFVSGGTDPFLGGTVGSYVQKFKPSYDLPFVFASTSTDAFNRNMIMSRFPIADINGDGLAEFSNFALIPDAYQTGGNGGIRGFQFAEIQLPDDTYAGDFVVGNAHLKSGGSSSDYADRLEAAQNTAYYIDYYYNGAGSGISDPNNKVILPSSGSILDENTPVVVGGDFNQQPGAGGPAEWMTRAATLGGSDGTDRDRSDSTISTPSQPISGDTSTQGGSSRLDYICWQDSVTSIRRQFIFRSSGSGMSVNKLPEPVDTFPVSGLSTSNFASDHRPVIVDFMLPLAEKDPCPLPPDYLDDNILDIFDVNFFLFAFNQSDPLADLNDDNAYDIFDVLVFIQLFNNGCP